jgi:hypothetical protein
MKMIIILDSHLSIPRSSVRRFGAAAKSLKIRPLFTQNTRKEV